MVDEDVAPGRGLRFTGSLGAEAGFRRETEEVEEVEEEAERGWSSLRGRVRSIVLISCLTGLCWRPWYRRQSDQWSRRLAENRYALGRLERELDD